MLKLSYNYLKYAKFQKTNIFRFSTCVDSKCFKFKSKTSFNLENAVEEIELFDPKIPIEEAQTPPTSWYLSKDIYQLEVEKVIKKHWMGIGTTADLQDSGDYITGELCDQPYLIVNDENKLKAFYNVCSHYSTELATGQGKLENDFLVCPNHGWTYDLNGNLIKATSMKGIKNFKNKNNGLKSIDITNFGPILFLNFSKEEKENLGNLIAPYQDALKKYGFDPDFKDVKFLKRKIYKLNCNWKISIDNYCDGGAHIPYAHKALARDMDSSNYTDVIHDRLYVQLAEGVTETPNRMVGHGAYLYPNTMFNRYGPWLDLNISIPINENECLILFEWYLEEKYFEDKKYIEEGVAYRNNLQEEDSFLCNSMMKGFKCDAYDRSRYVPTKQSAVWSFHKQIYHDLLK